MDIEERLKKGRFWASGNAHAVCMGQRGIGNSIVRSKEMFAKKLGRLLYRHKAEMVEVKPAVLVIKYPIQSLGGLGYRALSNAVKVGLRPTTVVSWGYGKMKLWWD